MEAKRILFLKNWSEIPDAFRAQRKTWRCAIGDVVYQLSFAGLSGGTDGGGEGACLHNQQSPIQGRQNFRTNSQSIWMRPLTKQSAAFSSRGFQISRAIHNRFAIQTL